MFTWSVTLVVTLTSTNVHSHKYGGGSSVATVTCQYVRTSQRLSAECFAEKECMDKCGVIKNHCQYSEPVCETTYQSKCSTIVEKVSTI